jgi:hypothetical protein
MKKIFIISVFLVLLVLSACGKVEHNPNDVKSLDKWINVDVKYTQIELHWEESYFIHDSLRVDIPDDWSGYGKKADFDDLNKHDLIYQYKKRTVTYWSGKSTIETELRDIDHEKPKESTVNFKISVFNIDIDSKLLIQDELKNDYYFKYDLNDEYNNYCYFKIAKNDLNQLKSGAMNEIRLDLVILIHIDGTKSFKTRKEDGVTETGYYKNVGVYYNPELTGE